MRRLASLQNNFEAVKGIVATGDEKQIHAGLDKMINTVRIFYESKQDFIDNFPDQDDIKGKVKLIINRRA